MLCYSLESPHWGDSNENTQHNFMLKIIEKISLICLLTWRYDYHSLARTTHVSNIFSWFQRYLSHWSLAVYCGNNNKIFLVILQSNVLRLLIGTASERWSQPVFFVKMYKKIILKSHLWSLYETDHASGTYEMLTLSVKPWSDSLTLAAL